MLQFVPESIESLANRYCNSVSDVFPENYSGDVCEDRKHVFDFEDGFRLIIYCGVIDNALFICINGFMYDVLIDDVYILVESTIKHLFKICGNDYIPQTSITKFENNSVIILFKIGDVCVV